MTFELLKITNDDSWVKIDNNWVKIDSWIKVVFDSDNSHKFISVNQLINYKRMHISDLEMIVWVKAHQWLQENHSELLL